MRYGLDVLGMAKYPKVVINNFPTGWACGVFANTFGNVWPSLAKLLATGKCPQVRIQAIWEDNHGYVPLKHDRLIKKELQAANKLKAQFPHAHVQFSPFCEHNIKGNNLVKLLDECAANARNIEIVNCPWKGDVSKKYLNEIHGDHAIPQGPYQYSYDGTSAVDSDVDSDIKKHSRAGTFFFWIPQFNGRKNVGDTTPRPQRQAWPQKKLLESVIYLATPRGPVDFKKGWIWKSHADQHSVPKPEPRALKPVVILNIDAPKLELLGPDDKVFKSLARSGNFTDGRPMYRSLQYGYETAQEAQAKYGSPVLRVRANGKIIGSVNAAFRAGNFR
jgi:hypothetical protein